MKPVSYFLVFDKQLKAHVFSQGNTSDFSVQLLVLDNLIWKTVVVYYTQGGWPPTREIRKRNGSVAVDTPLAATLTYKQAFKQALDDVVHNRQRYRTSY